MLRSVFFTGAILLFQVFARAQDCDSLLAASVHDVGKLTVTGSMEVGRRELKKDYNRLKEVLKAELQLDMAELLLLEVKSITTSSITENDEGFESYFNSETEIVTTANLSHGEINYCVDSRQMIVYGIYSLDRAKTAKAALRDCENRMLRLSAELKAQPEGSPSVNIMGYEASYAALKRDARVVLYLDNDANFELLNRLLSEFQTDLNVYKSSSHNAIFSNTFAHAQALFRTQQYAEGISILKSLQIDFPHKQEVQDLLETTLRRYRNYLGSEVGNYRAQRKYRLALEAVDRYCAVAPCNEVEFTLKDAIASEYFNHELHLLQDALKLRSKEDATIHISNLKTVAYTNPKIYREADEAYYTFLVAEEMRDVELELSRDNYELAYAKLMKIEGEYGTSYADLQSLRKTVEQKLLHSEVQAERRKRNMLFALVFGVEMVSNELEDLEYIDEQVQTATMAYSGGLYKKFNYTRHGNGYWANSDMIGIKVRFTDIQSTMLIGDLNTGTMDGTHRFDAEVLLDGTIGRVVHYAGGAVFPNVEIGNELIYSAELGLRLPMGPLSLQANLRSLYIETVPQIMVNAGIYCQVDFWRSFGKKDKKFIKYKLNI